MEEAPFLKDRDICPPRQILWGSLPGEHKQKQEQCEFHQKEFIPKRACPLGNKFIRGKENTIITFAQNEELWADTDWSGGRVEKGQGTSDEGRGSKKRKKKLIPQESLHTGHFGYYYFVNGWSRFKMFRLDKQPQMTQVFYHLRPGGVGGPSPPPVIPQQLGSKSQKRVPSVTLTPLSLSSSVLYYRWYLGWHFNTHVKKLKAAWKDVVLQGSPSVLAGLKSRGESAKWLPHSCLTTLKLLLLKWILCHSLSALVCV